MDKDTLIAALIGALIATIPILISNIVQIILHISEIRQKKNEGKIESREKWIERDILKIMDSVENLLGLEREKNILSRRVSHLKFENETEHFTPEEMNEEVKMSFNKLFDLEDKSYRTIDTINRLVHSFGDNDLLLGYDNFLDAINKYMKETDDLREKEDDKELSTREVRKKWIAVLKTAGKFHSALREKLISLRG